MPSMYFTINSTSHECSLSAEHISGRGGADSPTLLVPLKLDLRPINTNSIGALLPYDITSIKAELSATDRGFKCSETIDINPYHVTGSTSLNFTLEFLIS